VSQSDDIQVAKALMMTLDGIENDLLGMPAPTYEQMVRAFAGYELHLIDPDGAHALTIRHDLMRGEFVFDTPRANPQGGDGS